ncbi:RraA family protein [Pseudomonas chlororaphis]|uniref:RraA family protein n=1 Tax=Pseudomonas chlororaphis TaxID=587753 RepID=UPI0007B3CCCD|nr:RraA family protein [Pseudomonas chlororaphis]AZC50879.1 Putative achromobactin biosynthesis protein [Pseudomonas chlororaphis subsp. piscium]AZC57451.1 Putative achromobactin biosynthesis protein [Pseudomonas chlororaphis subsp. piscium]AZC63679.1 Putative achromobactin biosynthesis protein [Pseudomonas chlororaphis subsp. piscium]AZC69917.1 Putative achromobactin biosynthesis protein [Pseudomonas chlororaphis subsp. piscium]AZC76157.1 Putative achromobactin biosynthesis protein [Pseudomon
MIAPRQPPTSAALLEHYRGIAPSTLGHFGDEGYLRGIRPLFDGLRMLGTVVTVKVFAPDGAILRDALLLSEPGDVLVIQCLGDQECACWGELRTLAGLIKGLAGVVVEGAVTDVAALREHRLPVFSRGVSAYTTRGIGQQGEVNRPIEVAGVRVNPGDIAIGDDDGVFILDGQRAEALLPQLLAKEELDRERRAAFLQRLASIG